MGGGADFQSPFNRDSNCNRTWTLLPKLIRAFSPLLIGIVIVTNLSTIQVAILMALSVPF